MSFKKEWSVPNFQWPVDRGQEQYEAYVQQCLIARKIKDYGMRLDRGRLLRHIHNANQRAKLFTQLFLETTGLKHADMGPSGAGQTAKVKAWFKEAGAPDVVFDKKTKEPQFNSDAFLCWSADYPDRPFARPAAALLGLRAASVNARIARAYFAVLNRPGSDGRVHLGYSVVGTKGTRWSSSNQFVWRRQDGTFAEYSLNAQSCPKRKTTYDFGEGYGRLEVKTSLRDIVIADPGCVLLRFDYEGAEAALIAYNSGDPMLLDLMTKGLDIHTATARAVWLEAKIPTSVKKIKEGMDVPSDAVTALAPILEKLGLGATPKGAEKLWLMCREACKGQLYGGAYQAPSTRGKDKYPTLFNTFKKLFPFLTEEYFGVLMERFFKFYSGLREWQYRIAAEVREGPLRLPLNGKTLYLAPVARGFNQGLNFYQQSGIGVLIGRALPAIDQYVSWEPKNSAILACVHDELLLQARESDAVAVENYVSARMSAPARFGDIEAGVKAEGDIGRDWNDLVSLEKWGK